jgi:DNA-binding transcriptional MocR family regulator
MDLATSTLIQRALENYITVGRYESHLNKAKRVYRERRDMMEHAIQMYMPEGCSWISPQGGLFLWLSLPGGLSTTKLYPIAGEEGVSYGPGVIFYHDQEDSSAMRLNFTLNPPEAIEEGIKRLSRTVEVLQERISREEGWG